MSRKTGGVIGLVLGVVFGVFWWHPFFHVQLIQQSGNQFVTSAQLTASLEALKPISWLSARWGGVSRPIMNQFKSVQSVSVSGQFPHQLSVTLLEKSPWLAFYVEQDVWVVASDGTVLSRGGDMPMLDDADLLVVYGVPGSFFSDQGLNAPFLETMKTIVQSVRTYFPYPNLQVRLEGLYLGESGYQMASWNLIKDDDIRIVMETLDDLPQRFQALTHYFSSLTPTQETAIDYIDMRVPTKIIIGYDTP